MLKIYYNRYKIVTKIIKFFLQFCNKKTDEDMIKDNGLINLLRFLTSRENDYDKMIDIYNNLNLHSSLYIKFLIVFRMHNHRIYDAVVEKIYEEIYKKTKELTVLLRYFDFLTQKYGYLSKQVKDFLCLIRNDSGLKYLNKNNKIKLYTAFLVNDCVCEVLFDYFSNGKEIKADKSYNLYLCNYIYTNNKSASLNIGNGSKIYGTLLQMRNSFEELISRNKNNICIVGNAPSEFKKNNGKIIDSYPIVVRFNNYSLDYPDDYGKKIDIHVRIANDEISTNLVKNAKFTVFARNNFLYNGNIPYLYSFPYFISGRNFTFIPNSIFSDLIKEISHLPSTGILFLYYIYKINGVLDSQNIFGFSYGTNIEFTSHYFDTNKYSYRHLHDPDAESRIFSKIIGL